MISQKKGISGVIVAIIMIGLVMVLTVIIWAAINTLIKEKVETSESCFGVFGKVSLGKAYTCYDFNSNKVQFSINVKDSDIEEVLISISGTGRSKSFTLSNNNKIVANLTYLSGESSVKLPEKNSGITYLYNWNNPLPANFIQIAPVINGKQCEASDSLSGIDDCQLLA